MMKSSLFLTLLSVCSIEAFSPYSLSNDSLRQKSTVALELAGMGMGMATKSKKKKGSRVQKKSFDVSKAVLKSEKLYEELCNEAAKAYNNDDDITSDTITSEYVVTARFVPLTPKDSTIPSAASISDWVPVGQLCVKRPLSDPFYSNSETPRNDERIRIAISAYCRELSNIASLGASVFNSVPRNQIQYSVEPIESFYKFVYDDVIKGKNQNEKNDFVMTKAESREALGLNDDCNDANEIKKAYRSLTFKLHPDRFVGVDRSEEETTETNDRFAKVKLAYETLNSGVRDNGRNGKTSWYESLGGRSRTDFSGAIDLMSMEEANAQLTKEYKVAVCGLQPDMVMAFVTRHQAAARG